MRYRTLAPLLLTCCLFLPAPVLGAGQAAPPRATSEYAVAKPLDINLAGEDEFQALPGIGPVMARRIVEHRQKNGPFKLVDDLLAVPGIGAKNLENLRPLLAVPSLPKP